MKLRSTRKVKIFNEIINPKTGVNRIDAIMDTQKQRKEAKLPLNHVLFIFDDFISHPEFNTRRGNFTKIYSMARNFNISVIISSQEYKLIPAPVRKMAMYNLFYNVYMKSEREAIIKENCSWIGEERFEIMWNFVTKEKYNFLACFVDDNRFLKNFETDITPTKDDKWGL
jgi:hypothetical protein